MRCSLVPFLDPYLSHAHSTSARYQQHARIKPLDDRFANRRLVLAPLTARYRSEAPALLKNLHEQLDTLPPTSRGSLVATTLTALIRIQHFAAAKRLLFWFLHSSTVRATLLRRNFRNWSVVLGCLTQAQSEHLPLIRALFADFCGQFTALHSIKAYKQDLGQSKARTGRNRGSRVRRIGTRKPKDYLIDKLLARSTLLTPLSAIQIVQLCSAWKIAMTEQRCEKLMACFARVADFEQAYHWYSKRMALGESTNAVNRRSFQKHSAAKLMLLRALRRDATRALEFFRQIQPSLSATDLLEAENVLLESSILSRRVTRAAMNVEQFSNANGATSLRTMKAFVSNLLFRREYEELVSFWEDYVLSSELQIDVQAIRSICSALLALGRFDQALGVILSYGKIVPDCEGTFMLSTKWSELLGHAKVSFTTKHSVIITSEVINLFLRYLSKERRWQDLYFLWKELQDGHVFDGLVLDTSSFIVFLKAARAASLSNSRAGINAFSDAAIFELSSSSSSNVAQSDMWNGQAAWKTAIEEAWVLIAMEWQACGRDLDGLENLRSQSFLSRFSFSEIPSKPYLGNMDQSRSDVDLDQISRTIGGTAAIEVNLDSRFYKWMIRILGGFARAHQIWPVLVCQRLLSAQMPSANDLAVAVVYIEEAGASTRTLKALNAWLVDWVGEEHVPTDVDKGKALQSLTRKEGVNYKGSAFH